jgi:predicted nucleotidyltransferase
MKVESFEAIVRALNDAGVRFIVVGGLAVIAHGYGRVTQDVDLVIQLQPDAIANAFTALETLGYYPRVPITAAQFADAGLRAEWIREKGMRVLNFHSDAHRETPVDLFITEPFDFEEEYRAAMVQESSPGLAARILRLDSLLRMKAEAGRGQDLADIDELNLLHERKSSYDR